MGEGVEYVHRRVHWHACRHNYRQVQEHAQNTCTEVRIGMLIDISIDKCMDMCVDLCERMLINMYMTIC